VRAVRFRAARTITCAVSDSVVARHINRIFTKLGLHPADSDHRRALAVLKFLNARAYPRDTP
jgi:hypothetical protein